MAASFDPMDDRQHGHAIRRRQGGRTSMYHDVFYPVSIPWWMYMTPQPNEDDDQVAGAPDGGGVPSGGIPGSDGSTGAY